MRTGGGVGGNRFIEYTGFTQPACTAVVSYRGEKRSRPAVILPLIIAAFSHTEN